MFLLLDNFDSFFNKKMKKKKQLCHKKARFNLPRMHNKNLGMD